MCVGECPFFSLSLSLHHPSINRQRHVYHFCFSLAFIVVHLEFPVRFICGVLFLFEFQLAQRCMRIIFEPGLGGKYLKAASFSMCTNMNYLHFHVSARDIQLPQLNQKHRFQMNLLEKPNERTKKNEQEKTK